MSNNKTEYITLLGDNKFADGIILLWAFVFRRRVVIVDSEIPSHLVKLIGAFKFLESYIRIHRMPVAQHKGLWYEINNESIQLTNDFYDHHLAKIYPLMYKHNRIFTTKKFPIFIKKEISYHVFSLLKVLNLIFLNGWSDRKIFLPRTPLNKFVVDFVQKKYNVTFKITYISCWPGLALFFYYGVSFVQMFNRGMVFNKAKKSYKLSREAADEFFRKTFRDDMFIDNKYFSKQDIVFLDYGANHLQRKRAIAEAKSRNYATIAMPRIPFNINKNFGNIFYSYWVLPVQAYIYLLFKGQMFLFYSFISFYIKCLPVEMFMNLFDVKVNISLSDHGEVAETIVFNKYGALNVLPQWTDSTAYNDHLWAFLGHNVFYMWGDQHKMFFETTGLVDEFINIGCLYNESVNQAIGDIDGIREQYPWLKKGLKTVVFFDNSIGWNSVYNEDFYLKYLDIILQFCQKHESVNVVLKLKNDSQSMRDSFGPQYPIFLQKIEELKRHEHFTCVEPRQVHFEDMIAVSDLCINMSLNSPSTIALINKKNALYFDLTGDREHPLAKKYMDQLVFEDEGKFFKQMDNILENRIACKDIISAEDFLAYDSFGDSMGLERIKRHLYYLTTGQQYIEKNKSDQKEYLKV